jgi:hypothetical protein
MLYTPLSCLARHRVFYCEASLRGSNSVTDVRRTFMPKTRYSVLSYGAATYSFIFPFDTQQDFSRKTLC